MKRKQQEELEVFKLQINLAEYAEAQGYKVDDKESSRASTVMRKGDDKIVVATDKDGHGVYFSLRDERDNGSIVDFVQQRQGLNLGKVRQELRPWVDGQALSSYRPPQRRPEAERPRKPEASTQSRQHVIAAWMKMKAVGHHPYLMHERKLSLTALEDPRFCGQMRIDARGNAVFPHYDQSGITGYELKNREFTGFSKHGEKSIWHSNNLDHAPRVVVVESAIDALSHAQLTKDNDAAYISTGGNLSDKQRELLREHLAAAQVRGAQIVLATDADEAGRKLAREIAQFAPAGIQIERQEPRNAKDWNDLLKSKEVKWKQQREAARQILGRARTTILLRQQLQQDQMLWRAAVQDYWRELPKMEREAIIEAAVRAASPEELASVSCDAKLAGIECGIRSMLTSIERDIDQRQDPSQSPAWMNVIARAGSLATQHGGDQRLAALADQIGMSPIDFEREIQKKKCEARSVEQEATQVKALDPEKAADLEKRAKQKLPGPSFGM